MTQRILYGSIEGSRTWWTAWMCAELRLDVDNRPMEPGSDATHSEAYLALNPNGRVPTFTDDDFTIWESMAIHLYLAKKYGDDLYPEGLEGEAHAWQWSFWAVSQVEAPLLTLMMGARGCTPESEMGRYYLQHIARWDAEELARCRSVLQPPFDVLNQTLARRPYLLDGRFTVADLNVACIFSRLRRDSGLDLVDRPHLRDWLLRCWSREACPRRESLMRVLHP